MAFKLRSGRGIAAITGATLAIGGAGAAIGLAAGGGFGGGDDARQAFADALSDRVGAEVTVEDIEAARLEAARASLDRAVDEGRLSQEEADEMLERIQQAPERREQAKEAHEQGRQELASLLGITVEELREARRNGTSLAELARQNNVPRERLEATVKEQIESRAQSFGRELPDQADIDELVDRIVESEGRRGRPGGFQGRRGPFGGP